MNISTLNCLLKALRIPSNEIGTEFSVRQLQALLHIAAAGRDGIDAVTLEAKTEASQAATSRALKMFALEFALVEFFLDQHDGRRRLARLTPKGARLVDRTLAELR